MPCEKCLIIYQFLFFTVLLCENRHGYGDLLRFFSGRSLLGRHPLEVGCDNIRFLENILAGILAPFGISWCLGFDFPVLSCNDDVTSRLVFLFQALYPFLYITILLCRTCMRNHWGSFLGLLLVTILNFLRWLPDRFQIEIGHLILAILRQSEEGLAKKRGLERNIPSHLLPSIGILEIVISCFLLFNSPPTARYLAPRGFIVNLCQRRCRFS